MSSSTPASNIDPDAPTLASRHTGLLMFAVMGVSVCQFLDLTIANVALPHMRSSLGASMDTISWVLTSFIIAGVMVLPLTGWLSDKIGSRNLFLISTLAFVLSSMLCGAATSLTEMVVFRAMQGMASAFIGPMAQTIIFDINRPSKQTKAMALWGMVVMIGPISGPFIGGFLTETLSWRWVFYVNLPIGIPALILLWWLLPSRPIVRRRLDIFGAVLLGLGLASLQLMLDRGHQNDWFDSGETLIELLFAISLLWMFLVHNWRVKHPLFQMQLFKDPNFLIGLAFMVILGIANVALSSVLPTLFETVYRFSVMETGLLMAPRGCGVFVMMMITTRLMARFDSRALIFTGYIIAAYSLWMMTQWSLDMGTDQIILAAFVQGIGLGFVFVPVNIIAYATLSPESRTDGSTLMTLFRNLGSSFGISIIVTTLARNIQTSHADIASNVTAFNIPALDPASAAAMFGDVGTAALAMLDAEVNRQASMVAYLDSFYMLTWLMVAIAPLSLLAGKPKSLTGTADALH